MAHLRKAAPLAGRFRVTVRAGAAVRELEVAAPDDIQLHLPMTELPVPAAPAPGRTVSAAGLQPADHGRG